MLLYGGYIDNGPLIVVIWGITPQLFVGLTDAQRDAAAVDRSRWYSLKGLDVPPSADGDFVGVAADPLETTDQPLLLALALLDARISGFIPTVQADNNTSAN